MRERENVQNLLLTLRRGGTCIISDSTEAIGSAIGTSPAWVGMKCLAESVANGNRTISAKC